MVLLSIPRQGCSASSDSPALRQRPGRHTPNSQAMSFGVWIPRHLGRVLNLGTQQVTSQKTFGPTLPGHHVPSELHPSLIFMMPTLGLCSLSPSPAGPTAAAVQGTHSPECPNHPQERSPRTGGDGEKQGRGVRPVTSMHTISRHAGQSSLLMFSAGDPGWVTWASSFHLIYTHIHSKGGRVRSLGPRFSPIPGSSHPTTTFQNTQDRHPTHLGKLGNAPGPVRRRPTVGGPSGPGSSPLHGPQRAQFQAPQRRLGRTGERLVFRQLAEGPVRGWCVFKLACSGTHSFIQPTNKPTEYLPGPPQCPGHVTETKDQFRLLLSNKSSWGARRDTR